MYFLVRVGAIAIATGLAAWIVPGISVAGATNAQTILTLLGVALVIGLVNAVVKPLVTLVSGCLVILTLGLFLLVINALMLMLSSWIAGVVGLGFHVDGFWSALFGSIIISVVSGLISAPQLTRPEPRA